jgi:hypothetical protein
VFANYGAAAPLQSQGYLNTERFQYVQAIEFVLTASRPGVPISSPRYFWRGRSPACPSPAYNQADQANASSRAPSSTFGPESIPRHTYHGSPESREDVLVSLTFRSAPLQLIYPFSYKPHDFSAPDEKSEFTVAITDNFSLDSTILNTCTPDGIIFVDSTHRLQNENRAATTVFCTADSERHMMPGASSIFVRVGLSDRSAGTYLISAKITAPTLEGWILETIQKIEKRAKDIMAGERRVMCG